MAYKNQTTITKSTQAEELEKIRSAGTFSITPEMFEKLYLQPKSAVHGDLRSTFGNPTPLGLVGFVAGLTPLSCSLLGWRGAGGLGAANIGVFFFIGGPLMLLSGILEFFLGNTFPFTVFSTYGCVFIALAATLQPFYNSAGAYSATGNFSEGLQTPMFNATLGYFPLAIALLNVLFMVCSTRVNAIFFSLFTGAGLGFFLLTAALWALADGLETRGATLLVATGGSWFATVVIGWYLLAIQLLEVMGIKVPLPVGDFSRFWTREKQPDSPSSDQESGNDA